MSILLPTENFFFFFLNCSKFDYFLTKTKTKSKNNNFAAARLVTILASRLTGNKLCLRMALCCSRRARVVYGGSVLSPGIVVESASISR